MDFALIDDDETEDEEMFYVFLTVGSTPVTLGSNTSATVTIIDNDCESTSLYYTVLHYYTNQGAYLLTSVRFSHTILSTHLFASHTSLFILHTCFTLFYFI